MHASGVEGNPKVLVVAAIGLALILVSGPLSRLVGRAERSLGDRPASAVDPLLNKARADAIRAWRKEGGAQQANRGFLVLAGGACVVLSALMFLGALD